MIFGGGGSTGKSAARAFAREGASVLLKGPTPEKMQAVADDIRSAGGNVGPTIGAHDPATVDAYLAHIIDTTGRIDVSLNTVNPNEVQGIPLVDTSLQDFLTPVTESARPNFVTATASGRHMIEQGSGVIPALSSSAARESGPLGGFDLACAALECLTRTLATEVDRHGVISSVRSSWLSSGSRNSYPMRGGAVWLLDHGQVARVAGRLLAGRMQLTLGWDGAADLLEPVGRRGGASVVRGPVAVAGPTRLTRALPHWFAWSPFAPAVRTHLAAPWA